MKGIKRDLVKSIRHVEACGKGDYAQGYLQALLDVRAALAGEASSRASAGYWLRHGDIEALRKIITDSDNIVFFGGAGVSTESGIPDFRSVDGLYNQKYDYPPEVILSASFFRNKTAEFYKFYRDKMFVDGIKPNNAHLTLAELERAGKLRAVITQNIDGLHQAAGSENVLELHGSVHRNYCMECRKPFGVEIIMEMDVPMCECGGVVKPDVVLYEESLDMDVLSRAVEYISQADVLIIGGTSLNVYPAASLVNYYKGDKLVMINKGETGFDYRVGLMIRGGIGFVLGEVSTLCNWTIS